MKHGAIFSAIFHGVLLLLILIGIPSLTRMEQVIPQPVPIEILPIEPETSAPTPRPEAHKPMVDLATKKPEPKPNTKEDKKTTPEVKSAATEKLKMEEAVEKIEPVSLPEEKKVAVAPQKLDPKPRLMPKPQAKPKFIQAQQVQKQPTRSVTSILKDLKKSGGQRSHEDAPVDDGQSESESQVGRESQNLTMSEMDALRRQLKKCWNVPAGARYAEDLIVPIQLWVNPDRTIRRAEIVDMHRAKRDDYYRAAGENALRAIFDPQCRPLDLPPTKYEMWKVFTLRFNPKDML